MQLPEASSIIQDHRLNDIPNRVLAPDIRNILSPVFLKDKAQHASTKTSLLQICDHLEVEYLDKDNYQGMRVLERKVSADDPDSLFAPKAGETVTVIQVKEDMSITDMVDLIIKIREISHTTLTNPIDIAKMQEWTERVNEYSHNLMLAGLAMERVKQIAAVYGINKVYSEAADLIYELGYAINLEETDYFKIDRLKVRSVYEVLLEEQGEEGIDDYLIDGLNYARFGDQDENLGSDPKQAFERMARVYRFVSVRPKAELVGQIFETVVNQSIPNHLEIAKSAYEASDFNKSQIGPALVGEMVLRGIEQAYRELPIPPAIKKLMNTDLEHIDELNLKVLIDILDSQMGKYQITKIFRDFLHQSDFSKLGFNGIDGKTDTFQSLSEILGKNYGKGIVYVLTRWQDQLKTLGLGKDNLQKFSQWLEDPYFFDDKKIKQCGKHKDGVGFSWIQNPSYRSIRQINDYYREKIKKGEVSVSEYAFFQKTMLSMVIDQMRLTYGGWVSEDNFVALQDSSPSKIIDRMQLNCVGRSNLLLATGEMFGLKGFGVSVPNHATTAYDFADGERLIVEPSAHYGAEFINITKVNDPGGLLQEGEEVWESDKGSQRYLLMKPEKQMISGVLTNLLYKSESFSNLSELSRDYVLTSADIISLFTIIKPNEQLMDIKTVAQLLGKSTDETVWLLRRFELLCPYPNYKELVEESYSSEFEEMMKNLVAEALPLPTFP